MLSRRAALIVKRHHPLGAAARVGDDKADTRIQFARMPLHLGHDPALLVPRPALIGEAGVETANMVGRATDGSRQQMSDTFLENLVGFEADGVLVTLGFQESVEIRQGEGGIPSEVAAQAPIPVALNDRFQNVAPDVGAVDVAGSPGVEMEACARAGRRWTISGWRAFRLDLPGR